MRLRSLIILLQFTLLASAQITIDTSYFRSPLDIPLFLSGTFGELRSNHFHSGLDIKTQGTIGHPVYATADGYVSRIKIQSGGYGRSIYITHPNGYTTVYAHLDAFEPGLESYVKAYQYSVQKYEVNIYPPKNKFSYTKGQVIAKSGNSGRSGGPHLHYEIRSARNQSPYNGLLFGFDITDNIKPTMYQLGLYGIDRKTGYYELITTTNLQKQKGHIRIPDTLKTPKDIGFGIEAYDYLNGSNNRCGVYTLQLLIDSIEVFFSKVDDIPFNETRFINSHLDYALKKSKSQKIQKLFTDPYNLLSIYKKKVNNGLLSFDDTLIHHASVHLKDVYGNESSVSFYFKSDTSIQNVALAEGANTFYPNRENYWDSTYVRIETPNNAFYKPFNFDFKSQPIPNNQLADLYTIHYATEPIHQAIKLGIRPKSAPDEIINKEKMVIVYIDEDNEKSGYTGDWEGDYLVTKTRSFGNYTLEVDSLNPIIKPLNIYDGKVASPLQHIELSITDNLTGIADYQAFIDGEWALFEYDIKNDLIFYRIDSTRLDSSKTHDLEIYVTDGVGNTASYFTTFIY